MARRIGYVFLPLDVEFMDDERIADAGEKAAWLYLGMCLRSKQLASDGVLSRRQIDRLSIPSVPQRLNALTSTGLVSVEDDGRYRITGWEKHNATSGELQEERRRAHEAALLGNHTRWHEQQGKVDPRCKHCSPDDRGGDRVPDPTTIGGSVAKTETETQTQGETETVASAPRGAKAKRATSIPDEFPPDEQTAARLGKWAQESCPLVPLKVETDQWLDYHRAKGDTAKDWTASWRTWMRNAQKYAERNGRTQGQLALVRPNASEQRTLQNVALIEHFRQQEAGA